MSSSSNSNNKSFYKKNFSFREAGKLVRKGFRIKTVFTSYIYIKYIIVSQFHVLFCLLQNLIILIKKIYENIILFLIREFASILQIFLQKYLLSYPVKFQLQELFLLLLREKVPLKVFYHIQKVLSHVALYNRFYDTEPSL